MDWSSFEVNETRRVSDPGLDWPINRDAYEACLAWCALQPAPRPVFEFAGNQTDGFTVTRTK